MNVSAPALVPDPAGFSLLLAVAPGATLPCPEFAPSRLPGAGAEAIHSFQSALADLLPAETEPEREVEDPEGKAAEAKALITGVVLPAPAQMAEALPLQLSLPQFTRVVTGQKNADTESDPQNIPIVPVVSAAPVAVFAAETEPESTPALLQSGPKQKAPQLGSIESKTLVMISVPPAAPSDDAAPTSELKNLAFGERFTPIPMDAAADPPLSVPSIRRILSVQPAPQPVSKPQSSPAAPPQAAAAVVDGAAPMERLGHDMQHRQDRDAQPREPSSPDRPVAAEQELTRPASGEGQTETLPPMTLPAPPAHEISARDAKAAESRLPDPELIAPAAPPRTHPTEARTLSVRITDTVEQRVDLKISEHQGEVHVAVRSADADLAGSLRENLGELVQKLEQSGLRAEGWQPTHANSSNGSSTERQTEKEFAGGHQSGQQQHQHHSRNGQQGRQQDPERARWIEEIENTFAPEKGTYGFERR